VIFRGELLTKRAKMGLFILWEQDVGLAKIMREACLFVQKGRVTRPKFSGM